MNDCRLDLSPFFEINSRWRRVGLQFYGSSSVRNRKAIDLNYKSALQVRPATSDPEDFCGRADGYEIPVAGDQRCLPGLGEGGGEAIGVGQVVLRLEAGGQLGEFIA